jgi:hypothetical protein
MTEAYHSITTSDMKTTQLSTTGTNGVIIVPIDYSYTVHHVDLTKAGYLNCRVSHSGNKAISTFAYDLTTKVVLHEHNIPLSPMAPIPMYMSDAD